MPSNLLLTVNIKRWITIRNLTNINRNINVIFLWVYYGNICWLNFSSLNLSVNTDINILTVYTKVIAVKLWNKKNQTVWWHVSFTNDVTDGINPTVKLIREYGNGKLFSVYTGDITKGIIVRFKKENRMVTLHFYQHNC